MFKIGKWNREVIHNKIGINPEDVTLSGRSQSQNATYAMPIAKFVQTWQIPGDRKQPMVAKSWGEEQSNRTSSRGEDVSEKIVAMALKLYA